MKKVTLLTGIVCKYYKWSLPSTNRCSFCGLRFSILMRTAEALKTITNDHVNCEFIPNAEISDITAGLFAKASHKTREI